MTAPALPPRTTAAARQRAFSLIELMVVITLAAILLGLGVPSFRELIASQRVKTQAFAFANHALLARSEAIKRNAPVTLKALGTGWQDGWDVNVASQRLAHQDGVAGVLITGLNNATAVTQLTYDGSGRLSNSGGRLQFQFSDAANGHQRCIGFDGNGPPISRTGACP